MALIWRVHECRDDDAFLGGFGTGEGQYGKVYTCINVDTGELMAMKEVCFLSFCK